MSGKDRWQWSEKDLINDGPFGRVFKGLDRQSKETVAVKQIAKSQFSKNQNAIKILKKDVETLQNLNHDNIIQIYDYYEDKDNIYIVMEYCPLTLEQYLDDKGRLEESQAIELFRQIASGMNEAVYQNIQHNNIKPENILLKEIQEKKQKTLKCKISDFYYAQLTHKGLNTQLLESNNGRTLFVSPQQLNNKPFTDKADVWALGMILYYMIFHKSPWHQMSVGSFKSDLRQRPIVNFPYDRSVTGQTKEFLNKCLLIDEEQRINFEEFFNHNLIKGYLQKSEPPEQKPAQLSQNARQILYQMQKKQRLNNISLKQLFQNFDADGSGSIDLDEFTKGINSLSKSFKKDDIKQLFNIISGNQKQMQMAQFKKLFTEYDFSDIQDDSTQQLDRIISVIKNNKQSPQEIFSQFDVNFNSELNYNEFKKMIKKIMPNISERDAKIVFKKFDINGDQTITLKEFMQTLNQDLNESKSEITVTQQSLVIDEDVEENLIIRKVRYLWHQNGWDERQNELFKQDKTLNYNSFVQVCRKIGIQDIPQQKYHQIFALLDYKQENVIRRDYLVKLLNVDTYFIYNQELNAVKKKVMKEKNTTVKVLQYLDSQPSITTNKKQFINFLQQCKIDKQTSSQIFDTLDVFNYKTIDLCNFMKIISNGEMGADQLRAALKLRNYLHDQKNGYIQFFFKIDKNRDSQITKNEFFQIIQDFEGLYMSDNEMEDVYLLFDTQLLDNISFLELFEGLWKDSPSSQKQALQIIKQVFLTKGKDPEEIFRYFDKDRNGKLNFNEFNEFCERLDKQRLGGIIVISAFKGMDQDKSQNIQINEFKAALSDKTDKQQDNQKQTNNNNVNYNALEKSLAKVQGPNLLYKLIQKWNNQFQQNEQSLADVFQQFDKNDNEKLNQLQFKKFCLNQNNELPLAAVEDIFLFFDRLTQDQQVDFQEFTQTFKDIEQKPDDMINKIINLKYKVFFKNLTLKQAFQQFNKGKQGLKVLDFYNFCNQFDRQLSEQDASDMFDLFDLKRDSVITEAEFQKAFSSMYAVIAQNQDNSQSRKQQQNANSGSNSNRGSRQEEQKQQQQGNKRNNSKQQHPSLVVLKQVFKYSTLDSGGLFTYFDDNGNNMFDLSEFTNLCRTIDLNLDSEMIAQAFSYLDNNNIQQLTKDQLIEIFQDQNTLQLNPASDIDGQQIIEGIQYVNSRNPSPLVQFKNKIKEKQFNLPRAFQMFDLNNSEFLTLTEFSYLCYYLDCSLNERIVQDIFNSIDQSKMNKISLFQTIDAICQNDGGNNANNMERGGRKDNYEQQDQYANNYYQQPNYDRNNMNKRQNVNQSKQQFPQYVLERSSQLVAALRLDINSLINDNNWCLHQIFQEVTKNQSPFLEKQHLEQLLCQFDQNITQDEIDCVFEYLDDHKHGRICIHDFYKMVIY